MTHLDDDDPLSNFQALRDTYMRSLRADVRELIDRYSHVDAARKVVGIGSVGTRCFIVLLIGRDPSDPLVLQVKEARPSVLAPYVGPTAFSNHGERVVDGQRRIHSASDIFLGWGEQDGTHFYVRQLQDLKGCLDVARLRARAPWQHTLPYAAGRLLGHTLAPEILSVSGPVSAAGMPWTAHLRVLPVLTRTRRSVITPLLRPL